MGNYVEYFNKNNLVAYGFDGNPNTPELTNNKCEVIYLSVSQELGLNTKFRSRRTSSKTV